MQLRRLVGYAVLFVGIAPIIVILVTAVVAMSSGPCRGDCPKDIVVGLPFVLAGSLLWLGVTSLIARAILRPGRSSRRAANDD